MQKKLFILVLTILLIFIFTPFKLKAETGLQITPAISELILKPAEKYSGSFKIVNNNEFDTELEISKGMRNTDDSISIDNFNNSSTEWIALENNKIQINSQKDHTFNYTVTIPTDVRDGVYKPMFLFKLSSNHEETGATTSLTQLLPFQFNIFVSESGVYNGDVQISGLSVSRNVLIGTDQSVSFKIENQNVSPSKPIIRIQIVSPENEIIFQSVANESLASVLKDKPLLNTLDVSSAFKPDSSIGRYNLEVLLTDTLTNKSEVEKISFWFIPLEDINLVVFILVIASLLTLFILRLKKNWGVKKKGDKHLFMYK